MMALSHREENYNTIAMPHREIHDTLKSMPDLI